MRYPLNVHEVANLAPDYMGFIFYPSSPRFAIGLSSDIVRVLPKEIKRTGVFVGEDFEVVSEYSNIFRLDAIQLHGEISPEFCQRLQRHALEVIRAVQVPLNADKNFFQQLKPYKDVVDLFLFDAAGKAHGGNGVKFNWDILQDYDLDTPYLLSGGIGPEDVETLKKGLPKHCIGIDVNSKFETSPGVKDISLLSSFINQLR